MNNEEDEAFDDIARRQGAWGGGFQAKRQAAMDKINSDFDEEYIKYREAFPKGYTSPQPAQEPNTITFSAKADWVMRITADRRIEVNEGVEVTEAAKKVLEAMQWMLTPAQEPAFGWVKQSELAQARLYGGSVNFWLEKHNCDFPLYTAPPKREWVGLTKEEVRQCGFAVPFDGAQDWALRFYKAIEAKLKEKNNG